MENLEKIMEELKEEEGIVTNETPVEEEPTEEELSDLFEETIDETGDIEEDYDLLKEDFPQEELQGLESFDIDKYLKDNYAFKEIEELSFEEYKNQEIQKPEIKVIEKIYNLGNQLKGLETFDDFLRFKKTNVIVYTIRFGMPFEEELFGLEPKIFVCKSFTSRDYLNMVNENPEIEKDLDYFNNYIISNCVLYPQLRLEDVDKLEYGIEDVLLQSILKHSRFNTNYKIERL